MNKSEQGIIGKFDDIMHLLMKTFHASEASYLSGLDLTIQQFMVLNIVHRLDHPKMTDLAAELNVTLGNVTSLADRLIKLKYIKRQADAADRRIVRVGLTALGKDLVKKAAEKKRRAMALILNKMSPDDRHQMLKIMEKLARAINQKGEIE
jgi:DNA-binding MarR family transcriptional regulator